MFSYLASIFAKIGYVGTILLWNLGLVNAPMPELKTSNTAAVVQQMPQVKVVTDQSVAQQQIVKLQEEIARLKTNKAIPVGAQPIITQKSLTNKEIIAKVKPAVVYITTHGGAGSGMIIDKDGLVLTNAHVVEGSILASVKLPDGRVFAGTVIGWNAQDTDLAIIQLGSSGSVLPTVELGNSGAIEQGDEVFIFGYPFGLEGDVSFKEGTISRRFIIKNQEFLEISAETHPGNSGGPLIDSFGRVVGIHTQSFGSGLGGSIKFDIPIDYAKVFIPKLRLGMGVPANYLTSSNYVLTNNQPSPSPAADPLPVEGSTMPVKRNIIMAVMYNPDLTCEQLVFIGDDLKTCKLYKQYPSRYNWVPVD